MATPHSHQSPHPHPRHDGAGPDGAGSAGADPDESGMADLLDLDAEVLHEYLSEVTAWAADLADRPPVRIVDLGSGTGTGAFALLRRFPDARVVAVDLSTRMLEHLRASSVALGVADRVHRPGRPGSAVARPRPWRPAPPWRLRRPRVDRGIPAPHG